MSIRIRGPGTREKIKPPHRRDRGGSDEPLPRHAVEHGRPVWICRGLRTPLADAWPRLKHYD